MIAFICGKIDRLHPTSVILEASGIGYEINISLFTQNALQNLSEAKIYIHEIIREDVHDLYGFASEQERELFRLLITVNGVGANTARIMLSSYAPAELAAYISQANEAALKGVKGIGAKTAQRIIVELKDKILGVVDEVSLKDNPGGLEPQDPVIDAEKEEAISAFVVLGYPQAAAKKVVATLFKKYPEMPLNQKIKKGLSMF